MGPVDVGLIKIDAIASNSLLGRVRVLTKKKKKEHLVIFVLTAELKVTLQVEPGVWKGFLSWLAATWLTDD